MPNSTPQFNMPTSAPPFNMLSSTPPFSMRNWAWAFRSCLAPLHNSTCLAHFHHSSLLSKLDHLGHGWLSTTIEVMLSLAWPFRSTRASTHPQSIVQVKVVVLIKSVSWHATHLARKYKVSCTQSISMSHVWRRWKMTLRR